MKKILLLIVAPFTVFILSANTISQEEADGIVRERLCQETQSYTVYTKEGIQKEMLITSSVGERLELNYFCWVYYVRYMGTNQGCYLIVKESNGYLLEVNAKSGAEPNDLAEWKEFPYDCEIAQLWDYPVKPGMEAWKALKNYQEKVEICQIPENILFCLSTENLMKLCLQYPLFSDVYAFNCLDNGVDALFNNFNGIREFFERTDALKELLKYYESVMQNLSISNAESVLFKFSVSNLELLLSRYHSQNDDAKENYKEILQHLTAGHEKKIVYADEFIFQDTWFATNLFSRAKMIIEISPQSIEQQILGGVFCSHINKEAMDVINELSYQLIE